jgi:hypothetical protein
LSQSCSCAGSTLNWAAGAAAGVVALAVVVAGAAVDTVAADAGAWVCEGVSCGLQPATDSVKSADAVRVMRILMFE